MDYSIPFIVDERDSGIETLDQDYCLLEALRIISSRMKEDFLGLGNKETISSMGLIHIPLYLLEYNQSRYSLFFYDELMANIFSISLPNVSLDKMDLICEEISNYSAPYDFANRINNIIDSIFGIISKQHATYYTMVRKDIADCLRFYCKLIRKCEGTKFTLSDNKVSERNAEISRIYGIMESEQKKLEYLENNLGKLIYTVNQKTDELLEKTSSQRAEVYSQYSEKIDPLEKRFNEEINPPLLATLQEGTSILDKELDDLNRKYEGDIIPKLILERDIQLTTWKQRIDGRTSDYEWEIRKIETEYASNLSNIGREKNLYASNSYVDPGISYDADITRYHVTISDLKKRIDTYEDLLKKLKESGTDSRREYNEFSKIIRESEKEINEYERKIRNKREERYSYSKQAKNEHDIKLASFDTKKNNIQREYETRIPQLRRTMEEQIRNIEIQRDSCKAGWDAKIETQKSIYSTEKSRIIYSKNKIEEEYEKKAAEEKSKFEPMKREREQEDKIFENAIITLSNNRDKFNRIASEYTDNITGEFNEIAHFFGMPLDFVDDEYSGIIRLLIPIYVAEIKDKSSNIRLSILPPLIYKNGKCSYDQSSHFDSIKSAVGNILNENIVQTDGQPILHREVGRIIKTYWDNDNDIKNTILQHLRNNSHVNHEQKNILKLRVALEKMRKEQRIQENEYKRLLKIIISL